ncbi:hypothetical protein FNL39_101621 [Nocardia caishijiensis]|uniref:Uncharacterized protein n=1 Tax=Nocardia caishijiensis TaxID=184756 RepID=A0ABQ6YUG5_9NOCA|nr:hypothetical protein FNL39_101621 [Nocardia caishijiensis]
MMCGPGRLDISGRGRTGPLPTGYARARRRRWTSVFDTEPLLQIASACSRTRPLLTSVARSVLTGSTWSLLSGSAWRLLSGDARVLLSGSARVLLAGNAWPLLARSAWRLLSEGTWALRVGNAWSLSAGSAWAVSVGSAWSLLAREVRSLLARGGWSPLAGSTRTLEPARSARALLPCRTRLLDTRPLRPLLPGLPGPRRPAWRTRRRRHGPPTDDPIRTPLHRHGGRRRIRGVDHPHGDGLVLTPEIIGDGRALTLLQQPTARTGGRRTPDHLVAGTTLPILRPRATPLPPGTRRKPFRRIRTVRIPLGHS